MRAVWLWGPPIAWVICIFLLSSTSDPSFRPPGPDVLLHTGGYSLLGFLVCRALMGGLGRPLAPRIAGTAVLATALYGVSDEVHQAFVPGRAAELRDVGSDLTGGTIGTASAGLAALALGRWRRRRGGTAPRATVTLYTREGCHLCDEAHTLLERERSAHPFDLVVRDVDADPDTARRFGSEVPVIFIDGRKAFKARIDPAALRRRLERLPPGEA